MPETPASTEEPVKTERFAISVIIPTYDRGDEILDCVEALEGQTDAAGAVQTIIVDSSPNPDAVREVQERHPSVQVIYSGERLAPQEARNRGVALAEGAVIAFTDSDCVADPEWIERLLAAHGKGSPIVGGAIDPGRSFGQIGRNACKFALWLDGLAAGERMALPTANLSMTRETWDRIGPFERGGYSGDTKLVWRARDSGLALQFEPSAVVRHNEQSSLGRFLAERRERGHAFAAMRSAHRRWPRLRAAAYAVAGPVLFAYLTGRVMLMAARSRGLRGIAAAPLIAAGEAAWTLGEVRGYARHALRGGSADGGSSGDPSKPAEPE